MKNFLFAVACVLSTAASLAGTRTLSAGTTFKCSPAPDVVALKTEGVGQAVTCHVMGDVYSFYSKSVVVPAGSNLIGAVFGEEFIWNRWITPSGTVVQIDQKTLPFQSHFGTNASVALNVIVTSDLAVATADD